MTGTAAPRGAEEIVPQLLPWLAVLLVLIVVAAIVLTALRRMVRSSDDRPELEGFTLHSLRELHRRGDLSDEEWERARAVIIARAKSAGATDEDEPTGPDNRAGAGD